MPGTAVDAGPLVALFDRDEREHANVKAFVERHTGSLVSNWLAIGEAAHLLDFNLEAQRAFLGWATAALVIDEQTSRDADRIIEILAKYSDLPADLTDAALLAMCERRGIGSIATLDSDFDVLRTKARKRLRNVLR